MKNLKLALIATLVVGSINAADKVAVANPVKPKDDKDKAVAQAAAKDCAAAPAAVRAPFSAPVAAASQVQPSPAPEKIKAEEQYVVKNPFIASQEATWFDSIKAIFGFKRCQEQLVYEKWKAAQENGDLSVLTKEDHAILAQISVPRKQQFLSDKYQQFKEKGSISYHALYDAIEKTKQIAATGNSKEAQEAQDRAFAQFQSRAADVAALQQVMQQALHSFSRDFALNPAPKAAARVRRCKGEFDALGEKAQTRKAKQEKDAQALKARHEKEHNDFMARAAQEDKEFIAQQEATKTALEKAKTAQEQSDSYFGAPVLK